jgi:hypothetical protein
MLEFKYKSPLREGSYKDLKLFLRKKEAEDFISCPKRPAYSKHFKNTISGCEIVFTDVDFIKYKRNKLIDAFFNKYIDKTKYELFEFGIPYEVTNNITTLIRKIKKNCEEANIEIFGYFWIYDVGKENFGEHFHLALATESIKELKYPNALKIKFKGKGIHGGFVRHSKRFKEYLKKKEVFERGYRKRLYGKSINFKTIRTNINESKDYLKTI